MFFVPMLAASLSTDNMRCHHQAVILLDAGISLRSPHSPSVVRQGCCGNAKAAAAAGTAVPMDSDEAAAEEPGGEGSLYSLLDRGHQSTVAPFLTTRFILTNDEQPLPAGEAIATR